MKVAIATKGNTLESRLDSNFGRCAWFVVYDTDSKAMEFIPNPNKDMEEGAGSASVELLSSRKVTKIIANEFGMKIKPLLDSIKIQMIVIKDAKTQVGQIIEMLNQGGK
ncbi:MAG: NifB/NifX family molybdenum-iron cluster-binding protein [Lentimicrobium sp.]|jgi:predicted Fe-Mo cluster-binding NifX family protein|nr:NifB/NifX family molybdenum-iron cluster-binding protein [Lentimicrobium sp.]